MYAASSRQFGYAGHANQQQANSSRDNEVAFMLSAYNGPTWKLERSKLSIPAVHSSEAYDSQSKIIDSPLSLTTNDNSLKYNTVNNEPKIRIDLPRTFFQNNCESTCSKIVKESVSSQQQKQKSPLNNQIMELRHGRTEYNNIGRMINFQSNDIVEDDDDDISSLGSESTNDDIDFCLIAPSLVSQATPIEECTPPDPLPSEPTPILRRKRPSLPFPPRRSLYCSLQQRRVVVNNDDNRQYLTTVTNTMPHHSLLQRRNPLPAPASEYADTLLRCATTTSSYHSLTRTP